MTFIRPSNLRFAYEVNFATQPTQNIKSLGDGNVEIDGVTWVADGTANATTMALTNGTGLDFVSASSSASSMYLDPRNIVPEFDFHGPWRWWIRSTQNSNSDFEGLLFRMEANPGTGRAWGTIKQWNLTQGQLTLQSYFGISPTNVADLDSPFDNYNLLLIEHTGSVIRILIGNDPGETGTISLKQSQLYVADQGVLQGDIEDAGAITTEDARLRLSIINTVGAGHQVTIEAMRLEVG